MKTNTEIIWEQHNKDLLHFVSAKVRDSEDAKDILQNVFIKLHSKINTLKSEEKIMQWIYQITRNVIADHFRKQKFLIRTESIEIPIETESSKINEQFFSCIQPHINKLPPIYKEALSKTEFENYSQIQLANELKISYSAAKSRVQRAKNLLKKYFQQCCNIITDKYGNVLSYHAKQNCKLCGL